MLVIGASAAAQEADPDQAGTATSICLMAQAAATANGLPFEFFARLIWQESRFRPDAVGPVTRSGERARGIAQFMPRTASERGLLDPHDPVQALPKSAEFLRELINEFGNLGLAAAAYNAGPQRVRDWLEGRGGLPAETQRYVESITGRAAAEWAKEGSREGSKERAKPPATAAKSETGEKARPAMTCATITAMLRGEPSLYFTRLQQQVENSASRPWGVQISAGFSREHALAAYSDVEKRFRSLAGPAPIIRQTMMRSRGTQPFYQVRIGADTRSDADRLCGSLRKGGVACMVLRNRA